MDQSSWHVACECIFRKAKSCFNSYWVDMFKYGCGLEGHRDSAVSQEWMNKLSWFFCMLGKLSGKLKVPCICTGSNMAVTF